MEANTYVGRPALRTPAHLASADQVYIAPNVAVPPKVDLTGNMKGVRSQGYAGACAAYAVCCAREYQEHRAVGYPSYFSPQFIYDRRHDRDVLGMHLREVCEFVRDVGLVNESDYRTHKWEVGPHFAGWRQRSSDAETALLRKAANYRAASFARVESMGDLRRALLQNGPAVLSLPCYSSDTVFWRPSVTDNVADPHGHAVAVVGYNEHGFILRNSWGRLWGLWGYGLLPYTDFEQVWDVYTLVDQPSRRLEEPDAQCPWYLGCCN
jgi:hypothetical protein